MDREHAPNCAAAFSAWAEAWNKNPTAHIVLEEKWRKAAAKCGCLRVALTAGAK